MVFTFDIYGEVDRDRFFEAFSILCKQTTSLNLILQEEDGHPFHSISAIPPYLDYIDSTEDSKFNLQSWMSAHNQVNFDLGVESYYSALIKVADNHYTWYFNQHHIFTDAYCFQLLFNRMSIIYQSLAESGSQLDWVSDNEAYIDSCISKKDNKTTTENQATTVSTDTISLYGNAISNHGITKSRRIEFGLEEAVISEVNAYLGKQGLRTLAPNLDFLAFLMSSLIITLSKVGENKTEHLISNIFSQRFNKKSKDLAKPLLEVLSSQVKLSVEDRYADIHRQIYAILMMRKSETMGSSTLLAPAIVNFFDLRFEAFAGLKVDYKWHHCDHMDNHHGLRFHIFKYFKDDEFNLAFDIKGGDEIVSLGQRFVADFKTIVRQITVGIPVENICLLPTTTLDSLNQRIQEASKSSIEKDQYFINVLRQQADNSPNAIALYDSSAEVTYKQLMSEAMAVANAIKTQTSQDNPTVIIHLERSQQFVYSVIGTLLAGGSFVPVPSDFPEARVQYLIKDVAADVLIQGQSIIDTNVPIIDISKISTSNSNAIETNTGEGFYTLYTSGSTGKPKGVVISQQSFTSYLATAAPIYLAGDTPYDMPLFTSVGFDLTMTSLFLPLYTGGSITIYPEQQGIDLSIRNVILDEKLNCLKCTPSHLKLIKGVPLSTSIKSVIVGGENFTRLAAKSLNDQGGSGLKIFNEYGPTECTVGCIVHLYNPEIDTKSANVPIGKAMNDCVPFIADDNGVPVPDGVVGELCLTGVGLSNGYVNDLELTNEKYITSHPIITSRYYRSGDLARVNVAGIIEYLGRRDAQIKVRGIRIETGEIENVIESSSHIQSCVVTQKQRSQPVEDDYIHCSKCGLPSNYPTADFDENDVCGFCRNYESYEKKVEKYFETEERFLEIFQQTKPHQGEYDCIMLYSGGKDSTYALGRLVEMGLKVLTFTLDNGYISDNAKENITRITNVLKVDHIFGSTPHMNEIFVDSLKTHCNVCNGCFKTIYNLSLKIAYEKNIPIIVTGLSRGQFFETKLSEEIFWKPMDDVSEIEETLFSAREAYHGVRDIAYEKTGGAFIESNSVLQSVKIVDFYRYHDVTLEQLYAYINTDLPWVRPEDTGRSTNCLINKVGIYIHRQERGYSNYAFPYSWDVRTGHKTKEETIDEVEEVITDLDVRQIIEEIGYESEAPEGQLVAYYTGEKMSNSDLRASITKYLPDYMVPSQFIYVDQIPTNQNGKVDYTALEQIEYQRTQPIRLPSNELEELLHEIWMEVMLLEEISIDDNYFEIGGTSLHAIRIVARLEKTLDYQLGVHIVFQKPTIEILSQHILDDMESIMNSATQE
jgi:amino acid adenylation domain-containing protein